MGLKLEIGAQMSGAEFMSRTEEWKTYRTRFLVRAKQINQPLTFTDPLGREHCGRPGDYLVESSEGLLRIAPREIFEDVYVIMENGQSEPPICLPPDTYRLRI